MNPGDLADGDGRFAIEREVVTDAKPNQPLGFACLTGTGRASG